MRNDVSDRNGKPASILPLARDGIIKDLKQYTVAESQKGILKAIKDSKEKDVSLRKLSLVLIYKDIDRIVNGIFTDIKRKLKSAEGRQEKEAVFDSMEYRLRFLTEHIVAKAYCFGYAKTCEQLGIKKIYVDFGNSDDRKEHKSIIDTSAFTLDDIPPFHAYCTCKISTKLD